MLAEIYIIFGPCVNCISFVVSSFSAWECQWSTQLGRSKWQHPGDNTERRPTPQSGHPGRRGPSFVRPENTRVGGPLSAATPTTTTTDPEHRQQQHIYNPITTPHTKLSQLVNLFHSLCSWRGLHILTTSKKNYIIIIIISCGISVFGGCELIVALLVTVCM